MARFRLRVCDCDGCSPTKSSNDPQLNPKLGIDWNTFDGKFDKVIWTNQLFPTPRNTTSKKGNKMAGKFKLVIKDGDSKYNYDKHGNYTSKVIDLVQEFDTLDEALMEFLMTVTDEYAENKVSLVFTRSKAKK